jgi:hypothetical protein
MGKLFNKYIKIIESGTFQENEIIALRSAIGPWKRTSLTSEEKGKIEEKICYDFDVSFNLSNDQKMKGKEWLQRKTFKANGSLRKSPVLGNDSYINEIIKTISNFEFKGLLENIPVYRVYGNNLDWFEYSCVRGQFTVINKRRF